MREGSRGQGATDEVSKERGEERLQLFVCIINFFPARGEGNSGGERGGRKGEGEKGNEKKGKGGAFQCGALQEGKGE